MRWQGGRRSTNVEDRRDETPLRGGGGQLLPFRMLGLRGGIGGIVLLLALMYLGVINPEDLLTGSTSVPSTPTHPTPHSGGPASPDPSLPEPPSAAAEDEMRDFVSVILGDTEDTWHEVFRHMGRDYEEPVLVLFTGAVDSACGFAQAAVGPFYCPGDQKLYIDLSFYDDLLNRFHAPGDFAQAYVIAHEVGHHVQNLLGTAGRVATQREHLSEEQGNQLSVRVELQADCLAGVWAHHAERARGILEVGDLEEGLRAASAIGDDRLQMRARGYVTPESFTHGTSTQRVNWFRTGFEKGDLERCNTFDESQPIG
ncbi:MAG: neutral zinc metallopeptidase [Deltaproteobacteria bacterium]|nr:neutral zinc metallopeptidase [Deltaproteobacteria bacterium]